MAEPVAHPRRDLRISFPSFLVSLGQSAMEALSAEKPDLSVARQSVDLLVILQQKTRGNLDQEEEKLLDSMLAELKERLRAASGGSTSS